MKQNPIAQNVRAFRRAHHWTQEELAAASGVDVRTVQRAEAGHPLSVESLQAIAAAFDTTLDMLSISIEDFERYVAEFEQKYSLIHLNPIESGDDVNYFLGNSDASQFQRIGKLTDQQADAFSEFEEAFRDWNDLWSDLSPVHRRDAERSIGEHIETLQSLALSISMGQKPMGLTLRNNGTSVQLQIVYCAAVPGKTPLRFLARDKGVPVSFV